MNSDTPYRFAQFKQPSFWVFALLLIVIVWRFADLNYANWQTGNISNGKPGVKLAIDSERYLGAAENMSRGVALQGREFQFTGYIALIALIKVLNLKLIWLVGLQIVMALLAALAIFDSVRMLTKHKIAALLAVGLYLCNPFLVCWHQYIMTESLYTSLVVVFSWTLIKILTTPRVLYYLVSISVVVAALLIRPNGWVLLPVMGMAVLMSFLKSRKKILIGSLVLVLLFVGLMSLVSAFSKSVMLISPVVNLQRGLTVWGHDELNLSMPQQADADTTSMAAAFGYVAKHPLHSLKLGAVRAAYSLVHIRPYHDWRYQLHILLWIVPAYIFALLALIKKRKHKALQILFWLVLAHLFVIAVSYAEHDSRFDTYILPVFYIIAGMGITQTLTWMQYRYLLIADKLKAKRRNV